MKTKNKKTALFVMTLISISLTSCQKEVIQSKGTTKPATQSSSPEKDIQHQEGIISNNGYPSSYQLEQGYYCIAGQLVGQRVPQPYTLQLPASNTVVACGAGINRVVFCYKGTNNLNYFMNNGAEFLMYLNGGTTFFTPQIEELEVDPSTGNVYVLAKNGSAMQIYRVDNVGYATLMMNGTSANVFNNTAVNGYKSGSIAFVPNGDGTYRLVFSSESTVYASSGIVSWHFTISGNTLTSQPSMHRSYNNLPGTAKINTTYGNGNLYFARDASDLYTLSLSTNNVVTSTGITVTNKNDFGYYSN